MAFGLFQGGHIIVRKYRSAKRFRFLVVFAAIGRCFVAFPAASKALRCTKSASDWRVSAPGDAAGAENAGHAFRAEDVSLRWTAAS
ncbi:hypothetical protein HAP47_0004560 [Bradyrhizobium sp. 41S5]|uniref:hypothetical protein n=1 Tax=Bradyrhizobium sp. 41S5 TaxID=1404443 RepID=UPI00156B4BE7|nr:hypothetical protein [Bradyrhizobium sp. 41S5]UFX45992.1 hypothetical protein HAP47_0004560 [Bradyrhizobium sp. 41S5]